MLIILDHPFLSLAEAETFLLDFSPLFLVVLSDTGFAPSAVGSIALNLLIDAGFVFGEVA